MKNCCVQCTLKVRPLTMQLVTVFGEILRVCIAILFENEINTSIPIQLKTSK